MSNVIWKFPVVTGFNRVKMPLNARVLSCGVQMGQLCVWALVDPSLPPVLIPIIVAPTGGGGFIEDGYEFVGTIIEGEPSHLVWHVFARGPA